MTATPEQVAEQIAQLDPQRRAEVIAYAQAQRIEQAESPAP